MIIFTKSLQGVLIQYHVDPMDTFGDLKLKIQDKTGLKKKKKLKNSKKKKKFEIKKASMLVQLHFYTIQKCCKTNLPFKIWK